MLLEPLHPRAPKGHLFPLTSQACILTPRGPPAPAGLQTISSAGRAGLGEATEAEMGALSPSCGAQGHLLCLQGLRVPSTGWKFNPGQCSWEVPVSPTPAVYTKSPQVLLLPVRPRHNADLGVQTSTTNTEQPHHPGLRVLLRLLPCCPEKALSTRKGDLVWPE